MTLFFQLSASKMVKSFHNFVNLLLHRGTSQKFLIIWRNLNAPFSNIYSIFRDPSKELAEPLGSAEPRLKNTGVGGHKSGKKVSRII